MHFVADWLFNSWGCLVLYAAMTTTMFTVKTVEDWNENIALDWIENIALDWIENIALDWIDDSGLRMLPEAALSNEEGIDFETCIE